MPGVLIDPLHDEFGWSRGTIGIVVSVNLVLFGLIGPFAAALMNRYGLRRVRGHCALHDLARAAGHHADDPALAAHLLWGVVVGIGSGCMATVFAATVTTRWFVANRGVVTGMLTAASATGQLIFLPVLTGGRHGAAGSGSASRSRWRHSRPCRSCCCCSATIPPTSACCPTARRATTPRPPVIGRAHSHRVSGAARRTHERRVLAAVRKLLHLRFVDKRTDPNPFHLGCARSSHRRDNRGRSSCTRRSVRCHRHHRLGLAHRPCRPSPASICVLATWPLADGARSRARCPQCRAVDFHDLLRSRLGGHGAAHDRTVQPAVRPRAVALSCTGGCSPAIRSAPRRWHGVRAAFVTPRVRTGPVWIIAGTGCLIAAAGTQRISAVRPRQLVAVAHRDPARAREARHERPRAGQEAANGTPGAAASPRRGRTIDSA